LTGMADAGATALQEARSIQLRAAARGFDWSQIADVFDKVQEEVDEIRNALDERDFEHARSELGDLLFSAVNLSRFLDTDADRELQRTNRRFAQRFKRLEEEVDREGREMERCTLEELDVIWERVKSA
jgi:uncharacterized protein YabN with tetrapyrrole methylase and pyrophosphatase domain